MSGRGVALLVIAGMFALSAAGLAAARVMYRREALLGDVTLVLAPSLMLGVWAMLGLAWYLSGGTVS